MTPSQLRGPVHVPFNILTDVRTQIGALVLGLNALGYVVLSPQQQVKDLKAATEKRIEAIEVDNAALKVIIQRVDVRGMLLVQVKCIETKDRLVRELLACP